MMIRAMPAGPGSGGPDDDANAMPRAPRRQSPDPNGNAGPLHAAGCAKSLRHRHTGPLKQASPWAGTFPTPSKRRFVAAAANRGHEDPQTAVGITALMAIAAAVYGPMINRALQRDNDDQRLYDSAMDMLGDWIDNRESLPSG